MCVSILNTICNYEFPRIYTYAGLEDKNISK